MSESFTNATKFTPNGLWHWSGKTKLATTLAILCLTPSFTETAQAAATIKQDVIVDTTAMPGGEAEGDVSQLHSPENEEFPPASILVALAGALAITAVAVGRGPRT